MAKKLDPYTLGKDAFAAGKKRAPLEDHNFLAHIQTKQSLKHPKAPGAELSENGRRRLEEKLNNWMRGWDDARKETL